MICEANCGMAVHMQNGKLMKTEGIPSHPVSQGFLCRRAQALPEMLQAPERLRHPLRKQADGSWLEISWDDALDFIAGDLTRLKEKGCPHHLAVHVGQAGVGKQWLDYIRRFCSVYGTPNLSTAGSYCNTSRHLANVLTFGYYPVPDYSNSKCIVLWGFNPTQSAPPIANRIKKARKAGAQLIVVDPYASQLAGEADLHLQIRPGTDMVLALGLIHHIIAEELYNKEFVEKWTIGFDWLAETVRSYTPDKVEKITWVPAAKIKAAARLYATLLPASIEHGMALELQTNGFQTIRAIAILQSITGNLDIAGGAQCVPEFTLDSLTSDLQADMPEAVGQGIFPLFHEFTGQAQANLYSSAILDNDPYPIESMIVVGSNPLLAWPNSSKVKTALEKLGMLVVIDNFMTASAELADIVLPAATFLSQNELWKSMEPSGECLIGLAPAVIEEEGCLSDWTVWSRLANKMGFNSYFPWPDDAAALGSRIEPYGFSVNELRRNPEGAVYAVYMERMYLRKGFATRSGKVELYARSLLEWGYDPIPGYGEPVDDLEATLIDYEYPLTLSFGTRSIGYRQSKSNRGNKGKKRRTGPSLEIHPARAEELGLWEDEVVVVESKLGSIEITVAFNDEIEPRVVFISHGWDEAKADQLIGRGKLDPITGFPVDRSINVRVSKKGTSNDEFYMGPEHYSMVSGG